MPKFLAHVKTNTDTGLVECHKLHSKAEVLVGQVRSRMMGLTASGDRKTEVSVDTTKMAPLVGAATLED